MRPKTVWLFELLDTWKLCGTKEGMFTARRKNTTRSVEIFPDRRECPFATRLFWQATPTDPQGSGTHQMKMASPIFRKATGQHWNQKCRTFLNGITMKNLGGGKQDNGSEGKEMAMQSRNRIMTGISSSQRAAEAQGKWRSLSPWIESPAGHGMTVFSRKMRTIVPGCTSFGDTAIRCPASQWSNIEIQNRPVKDNYQALINRKESAIPE